uniref:Uncharacterized protein n=1 Tax=Meloidogyne enterolobii TaxID=390850 RepID=A0A6V7UJ14_MELEN|nr:unnamed protein product [Meloidogyne enterolobii]
MLIAFNDLSNKLLSIPNSEGNKKELFKQNNFDNWNIFKELFKTEFESLIPSISKDFNENDAEYLMKKFHNLMWRLDENIKKMEKLFKMIFKNSYKDLQNISLLIFIHHLYYIALTEIKIEMATSHSFKFYSQYKWLMATLATIGSSIRDELKREGNFGIISLIPNPILKPIFKMDNRPVPPTPAQSPNSSV